MIFVIAAVLFAAILAVGLYNALTVTCYTLESGKLAHPLRLVLLSDLHSCWHGEGQKQLLAEIAEQNPDIILMTGDIADDEVPHDGTIALLEGLVGKYACYYVAGNHEFRTGEIETIKEMFRSYGVTVLQGDSRMVEINEQRINICGVDDPVIGKTDFQAQLSSAFQLLDTTVFTILLSHRPELFEQYAKYPCDLVVSGHAHGGQWRFPLISQGLYAPNQGLFPKYTAGVHELSEVRMIVSRGLSRESTRIPRIFNRPELVVIDLIPQK